MNNKNTVPMKPALLKIEQLRPFEGHPYKVQDNEEMAALSESIRENGVLSPLVVRSVESSNEYEVISGHRRLYAARKAGLTEVPVLICTLDRDAAAVSAVLVAIIEGAVEHGLQAGFHNVLIELVAQDILHQGQRVAHSRVAGTHIHPVTVRSSRPSITLSLIALTCSTILASYGNISTA